MGRRQPRDGPGGLLLPRLGRRTRRGARRDQPLQRDGEGHDAAVRRRTAGGEPARRGGRQGDARRECDPHAQRRGRRRGRERGRGVRARRAVPLVPADVGRRAAAARATVDRRSRTTRRIAAPRDPRERRKVYKVRSIIEAVVDRDSCFEIGRFTAAPRSPASRGSTAGRSRCSRTIRTTTPAVGPRRVARRSSASSTSRRRSICRSCTSSTTPASSSAPRPRQAATIRARRARARRDLPGDGAVVLGDRAQGLRRGRRRAPERVAALLPIRVAVGELGHPSPRRRHRGRVQGAARSGRRSRRRCAPRSKQRLDARQSPFKTAEAFLVEEIVDPRDTRPLLCEFAELGASASRTKGPTVPRLAPLIGPDPRRRLPAMATTFWPNADHWSCEIPLDTPHPRLDVLAAHGFVQLHRPRRSRSRRTSTSTSSTWTGRAAATRTSRRSPPPTASSTAAASGTRATSDPTRARASRATREQVPDDQAVRRERRRRLRPRAHDQARAAGSRHRVPQLPPRRQQPLQPADRRLGRAHVARAHRQSRQLHAVDGHAVPTACPIPPPRRASRCTRARGSSSTRSGCGTSSCTTAPNRVTRSSRATRAAPRSTRGSTRNSPSVDQPLSRSSQPSIDRRLNEAGAEAGRDVGRRRVLEADFQASATPSRASPIETRS